MGKLVNEITAAELLGVSHRQMVRWRKERVRGKNPPYFVIDGVHRYDIELLEVWLQAVNGLEIQRKIPNRKQTVFPIGGVKWVPENLIEGEQVYIQRDFQDKSTQKAQMTVEEAISHANKSVNNWGGAEFVTFLDEEGVTHIRVRRS